MNQEIVEEHEPEYKTCAICGTTVLLQKFNESQEVGLKTDFRCRKCRNCHDCRKGAGHEKLSLKQEAEQELISESIFLDPEKGVAIAKLPFVLNPEDNLKNNRHIAQKMLDRILKKYCTDIETRESILKAWKKMIDKNHIVFVKDLSPCYQDMLARAKVSYWIPWNIQYKESISTPIRPVFNASSSSPSGFSLNDCLAKGTPDLVRLLSVLLDWQMGESAICGDISQFYPSISLVPEHWQYQRILLREHLDPEGELLEAVIVKLAFGVHSVSAQSEETVRRVANELWNTLPEVASMLIKKRYVDDVGKSTNSREQSLKLIHETSKILKEKLNMEVKGWTIAGEKPPAEVTKDGISVELGGHVWWSEPDFFAQNIPPICFDKKKRGKLPEGSVGFDPKLTTLEEYVPKGLSRRMITSILAKIWDLMGKTTPVTLMFKYYLRRLIAESPEWDTPVSFQARALWIQNFEIIESMRGLIYLRCTRPEDALRSTCRLWILVDAAEWGMILTVYVGWERVGGKYSCSHLYGRGLLGPESLTLPQKELHILSEGADVSQLLSVMLEEWVEEILVAGDSEIAMCWVSYETVKLNQYNRVRVINITSKISLENLFHIKGIENPADIGTRMKDVSVEDIHPGSDYLSGKNWMKLSKEAAIRSGVIKPIRDIKLGHEEKKVMKKGIVFDSFEPANSDVIAILMPIRVNVDKVAEREVEACYPFSPLTRNFLSFVNVTAIILNFKKVLRRLRVRKGVMEEEEEKHPKFSLLSYYCENIVTPPPKHIVSDIQKNEALEFIFKIESKLVKKFNHKNKVEKMAVEEDGILYSKNRVLEGQTVKVVGGLDIDTSLSGLFNLNFKVPLIDQHSPLALPLAIHLHSLFNHRGVESCYRLSLNFVKIIGGLQIFRSVSVNCVICLKDRKKYIKMIMGGLTDSQLSVSPVFYFTLVDMWGPLKCYCPGYERTTRRDKSYEVHFLVFSCVATGAVNVQLVEGKKTEFILEGCSRFFSETSVPKIMYPDDDGGLCKAFSEGEIDLHDLSGRLFRSKGILFETCPPQGHSSHGRVERVIRSLQDSFKRSGAPSSRCTATGWMTVGKAMEREVNDIPIGFLYDKSSTEGNPLLRVLRPSTLKGMNASDRAPKGLFTIPELPSQHYDKVKTAYNLWAKCWATSYLPMILDRQKWPDADTNLAAGDIVYFKLDDSPLKIDWRVGKVESVKIGRDDSAREATVGYKIIKEGVDDWSHSVVTRATREIIKLFEIDDTTFAEDMKAVQKAAKKLLMERGCRIDAMFIDEWPGDKALHENQEAVHHLQDDLPPDQGHAAPEEHDLAATELKTETERDSMKHQPFISCFRAADWYQEGDEAVQGNPDQSDEDEHAMSGGQCGHSEDEELLFLV